MQRNHYTDGITLAKGGKRGAVYLSDIDPDSARVTLELRITGKDSNPHKFLGTPAEIVAILAARKMTPYDINARRGGA